MLTCPQTTNEKVCSNDGNIMVLFLDSPLDLGLVHERSEVCHIRVGMSHDDETLISSDFLIPSCSFYKLSVSFFKFSTVESRFLVCQRATQQVYNDRTTGLMGCPLSASKPRAGPQWRVCSPQHAHGHRDTCIWATSRAASCTLPEDHKRGKAIDHGRQ